MRSRAEELRLIEEFIWEPGVTALKPFEEGEARKKGRQKDVQKMVVGWLQRTDAEQE
jgi:hypothetical protein